ncbi:MAG: glycosyltransferase [bacterium]
MNSVNKVSIIIPGLNEENNIAECLSSLLRLDYPKKEMEIIVVDNGSSDRTLIIAQEYNVEVLQHREKSVAGLRNLGAKHATGAILAFIDADCYVAEDWLKKAQKYFDDNQVVAWGAPPVPPAESTWVQKTWYLVRQKARGRQKVEWLESMNFFIRKKDFWRAGGFNEKLQTCEDVDLSYRLLKQGNIVSDKSIVVTHAGEASTVFKFMKKEIWRGQSNLKGFFSHGFSVKELRSLLIPLYFGLLIPLFVVTFFLLGQILWLILFGALMLFPTIAVLVKVRHKSECNWFDLLRLSLLLQAYFFSRTVAVFRIT